VPQSSNCQKRERGTSVFGCKKAIGKRGKRERKGRRQWKAPALVSGKGKKKKEGRNDNWLLSREGEKGGGGERKNCRGVFFVDGWRT